MDHRYGGKSGFHSPCDNLGQCGRPCTIDVQKNLGVYLGVSWSINILAHGTLVRGPDSR